VVCRERRGEGSSRRRERWIESSSLLHRERRCKMSKTKCGRSRRRVEVKRGGKVKNTSLARRMESVGTSELA
jgi:hypothetical protein